MTQQYKKNPNYLGGLWVKDFDDEKTGGKTTVLQGTLELDHGQLGIRIYKNTKKNSDKSPDFKVYKRKLKSGESVPTNESDVPSSWL